MFLNPELEDSRGGSRGAGGQGLARGTTAGGLGQQHCSAGGHTPLPDMDRAVLLSDGEAAALSIEEAAEESESFMHGNLSHVTALGQVHHIQDHAPQSAAFVRQKALAVAAITGVLLDPHRR